MIETTHVGSLPRGDRLLHLLLAGGKGQPHDPAPFDAEVQEAVGEYAMALFLADGSIKVGTFHDRFVATPSGWRFAKRRGSLAFGS